MRPDPGAIDNDLGARALLAGLQSGELQAQQVASAASRQAHERADLGAFITVVDEPRVPSTRPDERMSLAGLPVAIKDNIDVAGLPCTAGTPALRDWRPPSDAPIVQRLSATGAVVVGKTNMHELALGITSNNPTFGPVRNPYDTSLIAGGGSGGSAAAVAAGIVPVALGSDTAGSVRIPASLCGCVGFRPTVGRYSQDGVIPLSKTRDTIGLLTRHVEDVMLLDTVITGAAHPRTHLTGRRLGVPRAYFYDDLDDELRPAIDHALSVLLTPAPS